MDSIHLLCVPAGHGCSLDTLLCFCDELGQVTDMLTGVESPVEKDSLARDWEYSLNSYVYDNFGNVVSITDPMGRCETYAYNLFGDVISKTDKNNVSFVYVRRTVPLTPSFPLQTATASRLMQRAL